LPGIEEAWRFPKQQHNQQGASFVILSIFGMPRLFAAYIFQAAKGKGMAIGNAVQQGRTVHVYDMRGYSLFVKSGILHGFTNSTVVIQIGRLLVSYGATGHQLALVPAP
jgi:hypothetical protein